MKAKVARGETRPSRVNFEEPQPKLHPPEMPADLDAPAQAVWKRVIEEMGHLDIILRADTDILRCYCEAVSRYAYAQKLYEANPIVRTGKVVTGADGKPRDVWIKSPAHQLVRDNAEQVRLFARELGLSPSARAGLHVSVADRALTSIDTELGPPPRLRVVGGTYQ